MVVQVTTCNSFKWKVFRKSSVSLENSQRVFPLFFLVLPFSVQISPFDRQILSSEHRKRRRETETEMVKATTGFPFPPFGCCTRSGTPKFPQRPEHSLLVPFWRFMAANGLTPSGPSRNVTGCFKALDLGCKKPF